MNFPLLAFRGVALALALTGASSASASQYETIDYYVQQMITLAGANEEAGVLIFREQMENLPRPEQGDARQASPFSQHGQERLADGQLKEALAAFRQAFIADPADPEIAGALGLTYLRLRRFKEAERLLVYALSLAPTRSMSWLVLGQVYGPAGRRPPSDRRVRQRPPLRQGPATTDRTTAATGHRRSGGCRPHRRAASLAVGTARAHRQARFARQPTAASTGRAGPAG
jgi:tetratricopeptide (TPR) repeat protein